MAALEEGLNPELFVRLHRSAIVRKDFIAGFSRNPTLYVGPPELGQVRIEAHAGDNPIPVELKYY